MSLVRLLPVAATLLCGGLMLTASVARASVFTVTNLSNNNNVAGSLGFAIDQANASPPGPNTIQFNLAGTILLMSTLPTISGNLTINGGGVTISGNNSVSDFSIANGAVVTLNGLTITAGNTASNGGGIYNGGTLTIVNGTLAGNTAADGGGIYNSGTLTIGPGTLAGNTAADGGGIYNSGTLTVVNSTLAGNTATDGGGIYNNSGMVTLTNSTFLNNSAIFGDDIYNNGGTVTETPIPAALPLFATGLGALGLLGWRRKRKG